MPFTAMQMVSKMEDAYQNLQMTIMAGDTITREKRNEIILEIRDLITIAGSQNQQFLGCTPAIQDRFETLKVRILQVLPALKQMTILD